MEKSLESPHVVLLPVTFALTGRGIIVHISGEPASKANSRKIVKLPDKRGNLQLRSIKSKKARGYLEDLQWQVRRIPKPMTGPVRIIADVFYASWRPDLDESVILDGLQGRVYVNDRQVVEKRIRRFVDPKNPRTVLIVEEVSHPHWHAPDKIVDWLPGRPKHREAQTKLNQHYRKLVDDLKTSGRMTLGLKGRKVKR